MAAPGRKGALLVKPVFSLPRSIINPNFVLSGLEGGRTNQRTKTWRMQGGREGGRDIYIYIYTRGVAGS